MQGTVNMTGRAKLKHIEVAEAFLLASGPLFGYLVPPGAFVQRVQLSAQFVHLVTDVVHLRAEPLVEGQMRVKLSLVLAALLVCGYGRVQPGGTQQLITAVLLSLNRMIISISGVKQKSLQQSVSLT